MTAKKKATKKTGKAQNRRNVGAVGQAAGYPVAPFPAQPFPEALATFDAALKKMTDARTILDVSPSEEVTAHRAQVLANLTSEVSMAAHTLNAAAYAKAQT